MLQTYGVKPKSMIVKNSQSNGLYERMNLVLCEMLRLQKLVVPKESIARREINRIYSMGNANTHPHGYKYLPGRLIFQRNMIIYKKLSVA